MARYIDLSPIAERASELFPALNVRIANYRYDDCDASFVAIGMYHQTIVELTYRIVFLYGGDTMTVTTPTYKMGNLPQYECIGTFTTVSGVEQFRNDVCLLSEKE